MIRYKPVRALRDKGAVIVQIRPTGSTGVISKDYRFHVFNLIYVKRKLVECVSLGTMGQQLSDYYVPAISGDKTAEIKSMMSLTPTLYQDIEEHMLMVTLKGDV